MQEKHVNAVIETAKDYATAYEQEKAKFVKAFETNPAYAIAWYGESMTIAQKMYELVERFELTTNPLHVAPMCEEITRRLCERMVGKASSTGHFHNASDQADADAHSRVLGDFARYAKVATC